MNKIFFFFIVIAFLSVGVIGTLLVAFFIVLPKIDNSCLKKNESVDYEITDRKRDLGDSEADVNVSVFDKMTNFRRATFQINGIWHNNDYQVSAHECGVYVIRMFNYDYHTTKQKPGYRDELWKYSYDGHEKKIALLAEKRQLDGLFFAYYNPDFRVDPAEKFVVLIKGYLGKQIYAVVIKNLKTLKDDFVLSIDDIKNKYPNFVGYFDFNEWTKDGRYFWGNIADKNDPAYTVAFFRIEAGTWKWEIFPAPEGTMGGDKLNVENGWVTYDDGAPWTGDADFAKMYEEEWKKEGKKVHFYLYSLITKEQILLATIDDPAWGFGKKWLSDTELEYTLPGDIKKVYKID